MNWRSDYTQLEHAQWVLERQLTWIAAADSKVGAILAFNTALIGGLAASFTGAEAPAQTDWARLMCVLAGACVVASVVCCALALIPRTAGPPESLVFFGRITDHTQSEYESRFVSATEAERLLDVSTQIHANAEIAAEKFFYAKKAILWTLAGAAPWLLAIALLSRTAT